jgi:sugar/nucleoside kinase (ribokinase family)
MKRIATLGSCYVDINTYDFPLGDGPVDLEQELVGGDYELVAGGSAPNSCRMIKKLGVLQPVFVGVVGDDPMGAMVKDLLLKDNIQAYLHEYDGVGTGIGFNMTSKQGKHLMLVTGTANAHMDSSILPTLERALEDADYLFLGGAFKLKKLYKNFNTIVQMAKDHNVQIVVDHNRKPTGTNSEHMDAVRNLVKQSDIYFPSRDEFLDVWQVASIQEGLENLKYEAPNLTVVVKDGGAAVVYQSLTENGKVHPPHIETVGNVTGAGDAFDAATLSALAKGKSLGESIEYGCTIAAEKIRAL